MYFTIYLCIYTLFLDIKIRTLKRTCHVESIRVKDTHTKFCWKKVFEDQEGDGKMAHEHQGNALWDFCKKSLRIVSGVRF